MPSDFDKIALAGKVCCNCGVSSDKRKLLRLNTYSVSLACLDCWYKHRKCADCQKSCTKEPHSGHACKMCGCPQWRHGLESEFDRQYASCVGMPQRSKMCRGFGGRQCNRLIFALPSGEVPALCDECMPEWIKGVKESAAAAGLVLDSKEMASIVGPESSDIIQ